MCVKCNGEEKENLKGQNMKTQVRYFKTRVCKDRKKNMDYDNGIRKWIKEYEKIG